MTATRPHDRPGRGSWRAVHDASDYFQAGRFDRPRACPDTSEDDGELTRLRTALFEATPVPIPEDAIVECLTDADADKRFNKARLHGLDAIPPEQRAALNRVTGEVAESLAEVLLAEVGLSVFWHIVDPGVRGVDLLFLTQDESVLALEVKGTLRPGAIPRLTPSRLRQMSRDWLNGPDNPAMNAWGLEAKDLYAGLMVVDCREASARVAVSGDFENYLPLAKLEQLRELAVLFG